MNDLKMNSCIRTVSSIKAHFSLYSRPLSALDLSVLKKSSVQNKYQQVSTTQRVISERLRSQHYIGLTLTCSFNTYMVIHVLYMLN